jgi:hypothetical protein
VTDANGATATDNTTLTIPAYPAPNAEANGPYNPAPTSGGVPLDSTGSSIPNGPGNYSWTIVCPPGGPANTKTFVGQSPNVTYNFAGADFGPFLSATTCNATLTVTDANGVTDTDTAPINFPAIPPPVAEANGPYNPPTQTGGVPLDPTGSNIPAGPGTYNWTVVCPPGGPANTRTYTTQTPNVTYNTPGADFGVFLTNTTCTATLAVTDIYNRTVTDTAPINFPGIPPPVAEANGPYNPPTQTGGVPLNPAGSNIPAGPGTYNWTVVCPPGGPANTKTYTTQTPNVTYNTPGADFGVFLTNTTCTATLAVTDIYNRTVTDTAPINFPGIPPPIAEANGPYSPTPLTGTVPLNSNGSSVPLGPGTYNWTIVCPPGGPANTKTFQGQSPSVSYNSPGADFGPFLTTTSCTATVSVTDEAGRVATDTAPIQFPAVPPPTAEANGPYSPPSTQTTFPLASTGSSSVLGPLVSTNWTVSGFQGNLFMNPAIMKPELLSSKQTYWHEQC